MFVPESLKKQNELIRTLQQQLDAKEREVADQKWILAHYLQSPSWRLTAPLRWIARRLRGLKQAIPNPPQAAKPVFNETADDADDTSIANEASIGPKELYSSLCRVSLQIFLTSGAALDLPTQAAPHVSIILVVFNRAELTLACLRSIRENFNESFEVIIADNASTDETPVLLNRIRGARVIRNEENRNFLLAVNQAAREARGRHLLLLNNDAQLLPGTLRAAIDSLESEDNIGAVGGRIIRLDGSLQEAGSIVWRDGSCLGYGRGDNPLSSTYMFRRDVDYCSGAFLLTPRSTWEKLGGFDETFRPAYYEETDYCMRLWEQGLRVVYEPAAVILHYEFASQSISGAIELQASHQRIFAERHTNSLKNHFVSDPGSILSARMHIPPEQAPPLRLLFIDDCVPHPWLGSGFPRARSMLLALRKQGFFLTLYPIDVLAEDWATVYSDLPHDIEIMTDMGPRLLEAFLRHRRGYYNAIVVSRPHNMNRLEPVMNAHPDWFENTAIIYDAEALIALRDVRLRESRGETLTDDDSDKIYRDEVALAAAADCVIAVSEIDRAALRSRGVERVYILGHTLDAAPTPRSFSQRAGFLFVGAIHDESSPNGDSMIWFLSEIWPRIQARLGSEVPLTIAGINKSERMRAMAGPGVRIVGHLDDVTGLYDHARVFVAPTRFAAGIPHKVHEAAARGVPVVATSTLARQLEWHDGMELSVADDAESFAASCITLHEDERQWLRIRERALNAIRRECSPEIFERQLHDILAANLSHRVTVGRRALQ